MSSIEAVPSCYDPSDWQLLDNDHPYEGTKYQTDLMVGYFEAEQQRRLLPYANSELSTGDGKERLKMELAPRIRHLLVHPGVASTNIAAGALNWFLAILMDLAFYFVRSFNNTHSRCSHLTLHPGSHAWFTQPCYLPLQRCHSCCTPFPRLPPTPHCTSPQSPTSPTITAKIRLTSNTCV